MGSLQINRLFSHLTSSIKIKVNSFITEYGLLWSGLVVIQFAVYTYFFTSVIFNDHTFPYSWLYKYPSVKTLGEGRWLADLIIYIQGGSGVQSFQMAMAVSLQAFNGIMLALLVGIRGRWQIFLIGSLLCFYPAFMDYYSFPADHLSFVMGDTLALFGAYFLLKSKNNLAWAGLAILFFMLSLAVYGPKIALIGFIVSAVLLMFFSHKDNNLYGISSWIKFLRSFVVIGGVFVFSILLFWITTRLTITYDIGMRAQINKPEQMLSEVLFSYPWIWSYFSNSDGFPQFLQLVPMILIFIGILSIIVNAYKNNGIFALFCCIIVILIQPVLLRLSYIVNSNSWADTGRIVAANGYLFAFFVSFGLLQKFSRRIVYPLSVICLYFFITLASQNNNAAEFKTLYDINFLNRIAYRIESVIDSTENRPMSLVVLRNYPTFNSNKYIKYPSKNAKPHFLKNCFPRYRQTEIMNFFLGDKVFRKPTKEEIKKVKSNIEGRSSWPAKESVFLLDDIMVVILEKPPHKKISPRK